MDNDRLFLVLFAAVSSQNQSHSGPISGSLQDLRQALRGLCSRSNSIQTTGISLGIGLYFSKKVVLEVRSFCVQVVDPSSTQRRADRAVGFPF